MKHFLLLFLLVSSLTALAQKEANLWYFGEYAGLDFNTGKVTVIKNGKTNTQEGTTTVADKNGNLLFYSDGITVWNKNHVPMPNGFGLTGHKSAIQSVIAVPKPRSSTLYYLFTVDAIENNLSNGLRYSILDMSLNNGLGDITSTKNILLETPVTEKLTVVRHANNKDFWILVHKWDSSEFSSYLLTSSGVSPKPVNSRVGSYHGGDMLNAIGFLKASGDGKKIALAVRGSNRFELFDFDANTGLFSNGIMSPEIFVNALGVEFSPDGKKLYGAVATSRQIFQFDLTAPKTQIFYSGIVVGNSADVLCGLQLAPDGKIYTTRRYSNYLGVIHNPNQTGPAANFVDDGVYLGPGRYVWFSLPNFIPQYLQQQPIIEDFSFSNTCLGDSTKFNVKNVQPNLELSWNFGDPNSGDSNFSIKHAPSHRFSKPGKYLVKLMVRTATNVYPLEKSITINEQPFFELGPDTTLCKGEKITLGKSIENTSYTWQDNSKEATYVVSKAGKYWVEIKNANGCSYTDTIEVKYRENECQPIIPNIITPNGDGLNETFTVKGTRIKNWQIKIFNRWGNLVYQNPNYENEWNARQQPDGVYYYVLHNLTSQQTFKGYVEVIK